jgi:hypothetical protein
VGLALTKRKIKRINMKVISWNIAGGHKFVGSVSDAATYEVEDLDYFIKNLTAEKGDLLGLQEVHTPTDEHEQSQASIIAILKVTKGEDFEYQIQTDVLPQVVLGDYKKYHKEVKLDEVEKAKPDESY